MAFATTKSLYLHGPDAEYVSMPDAGSPPYKVDGTTAFSISCWVRYLGDVDGMIWSKTIDPGVFNNDQFRGYELIANTTGQFSFSIFNNNSTNWLKIISTTAPVVDGKWHQVVVTYSGNQSVSGCNIYLDGVLLSKSTTNNTLTLTCDNSIPLVFGSRGEGVSIPFNGGLDHPAFWGFELSQANVTALFGTGKPVDLLLSGPVSPAPLAWWQFGDLDDNGTTTFDHVGAFDGTLSGGMDASSIVLDPADTTLIEVASLLALNFNGTSDFVTMSDPVALQFERTERLVFSVWFKIGTTTASHTFISKTTLTGNAEGTIFFLRGANQEVAFFMRDTAGLLMFATTTLQNLDDNVWHHAIMSYDGSSNTSGINFWIDGVSSATVSVTNTLAGSIAVAVDFMLGSRNNIDLYLNGDLDEVAIWEDWEFNDAQAALLYNSGTPADARVIGPTGKLIAYWPTNGNDNGTTIFDRSINTNDGTLSGGMDASNFVPGSNDPMPGELVEDIDTGNVVEAEVVPFDVEHMELGGDPPPPTSDTIAPIVDNFSPTPGATIEPNDPIEFDVTDDSGEFRRIIIVATNDTTGIEEVVYNGDEFRGLYLGVSARTIITGGFHFSIVRNTGWVAGSSTTFRAFAIDQSGNENI